MEKGMVQQTRFQLLYGHEVSLLEIERGKVSEGRV
jgi:hypothetical protein